MQSFDDRPHQQLTNTTQHEGLERVPSEFIATGSDVTSTTSYKMEVNSHIAKIENDHGGENEGWICADRKSLFGDDCIGTAGKTSDVFVGESSALPGLNRTYLPSIAPASASPSTPRLRSFSIDAILGTQSDVNDLSSDCMARANNMASNPDDVIKSNRPRSRRSVRPKPSRRARRDAANEELQKIKFHGKSEHSELPPAPVLKTPDGKLFISQDAWENSMNASPQNRLPHRMAFGNSNGNCNELSPIGVFSVSWPASSANQDPATSQAWNRHQQTSVSSCHGQRQGQSHVRHGPRSKRIRTIFTADQLHQLEAQFERQQYMVGTERFYLASSLRLTEAQVKVWFQNRRIKWRKQSVERQQAKMAVVSYNKLIDADEFEEVSENDDNTSYSDSNDVTESCYSSHDDVTRPTDRTELQAMVHPMFGMTNWSCMDINGGSVMADVHRNNINAALLS